MNVDYIKDVIKKYLELPYKCILIDGEWGIGKSYAVQTALRQNSDYCIISVYGMRDAEDIYRKILLTFLGGKHTKHVEGFTNAVNSIVEYTPEIKQYKDVIKSFFKWKDLFEVYFNNIQRDKFIVVIDDIERIRETADICDFLGVVEDLKKYELIKIVLIANLKELSEQNYKLYKKYEEKVVERTYRADNISKHVSWHSLQIDSIFIEKFISKHHVKNFRTIIKAQKFYDEVIKMSNKTYNEAFCATIRDVCYGIAFEAVDELYKEKEIPNNPTPEEKISYEINNKFENRIIYNYLGNTNITSFFLEKLIKYWQVTIPIKEKDWDEEYRFFLGLGEKAYFYQSDIELRITLKKLKKQIDKTDNYKQLICYQERYIIWNEYLKQDITLQNYFYENRLYQLMLESVINGNLECIMNDGNKYSVKSKTNKDIVENAVYNVQCSAAVYFVRHLAECTKGDIAFKMASNLLKIVRYSKKDIAKIDYVFYELYNKKSLPIVVINDEHYDTMRMIMLILKIMDKDKLEKYLKDVLLECDLMSSYRIKTLMSQVCEDPVY